MSSVSQGAAHSISPRPVGRPLVPLALATMAGIVVDAYFPVDLFLWLAALAGVLALAFWLHWRSNYSAAAPLFWLAALLAAGGWHHRCTRVFAVDDIGNWAGSEPGFCRVIGQIVTEPTIAPKEPVALAAPWQSNEATAFHLNAREVIDASGHRSAAGRVAVRIGEAAPAIRQGDTVEIVGLLRQPPGPMNDGEFDYRHYLAARRMRAFLSAERADCITVLKRLPWWSIWHWRNEVRATASRLFRTRLGDDEAGIADAALLGKQRALTHNETTPFLESGTLHLLVVSGQHLALLAAVFWWAGNLLGLPLRGRAIAMIAIALLYAFLTGNDPPVVRSAVTITLFFGNYLISRPVQPLNSLAGAIIVVLALDPSDLFRGGPQLSFIAVLAILLLARPMCLWLGAGDRDERWAMACARWLLQAFAISFAVCVVTAPLILHRFHLLSPISMLLSPLLAPLLLLLLIVGPIYVVFALLVPPAAAPLGAVMHLAIGVMRLLVRHTDSIPGAFVYSPAPPTWWVVGFYAAVFLPWCLPGIRRAEWRYLLLNVCWLLVGGATMQYRPAPGGFEYHQLAVGHGVCTVLRCPTGHTVMYDCGSMQGPAVVERTVAPWLWSRGIGAVDAVFISHADIDHYGGVVELARRMPLGVVFLTPRFARSNEPAVAQFAKSVLDRGINVRFAWAGDALNIGAVAMQMRHPRADDRRGNDNSGSMVLDVRCQGRRFLLTGDLEGQGLRELLALPPQEPVDLFMAPHHGGRASNTKELAEWARPKLVISSQQNRRLASDPLAVYAAVDADVLRTNEAGTISCRVLGEQILVETFRNQSRENR